MRIFFLRHGETIENANGIIQGQLPGTLSQKGINDTMELVNNIKTLIKTGMIISSDLRRATDTASLMMKSLDLRNFAIDTRLRERGFGVLEGQPIFALKRLLIKQSCHLNEVMVEGAENQCDFESRISDFFHELCRSRDRTDKLVITHAGVLQVISENHFGKHQPVFKNNSGFLLSLQGHDIESNKLME